MKNKIIKTMMVMMLVVMAMAIMPAAFAAYEETGSVAVKQKTGEANLQVLTLKYEPFPVNPGEYVDIWLKLGNEGDGDIRDLTFELVPKFPFSLDSSETAARNYGKILANSMVLANYKVKVSEDAVEGDSYLKYRYRYRDSNLVWVEGTIKIRIQTREAILSIESVETIPGEIIPGQEADIKIKVKNLANSVIRDLALTLDLTMSTVAKNPGTLVPTAVLIDSYYNAIPIAPIDSSTEKRISHLKPGEEALFTYKVRAFPDAESKVYKVPLKIEFQDELGSNRTKSDILGLVIGAVPDLDTTIDKNTIYGAKKTGDITVKIVNKGVTDIKFLNIVLEESEDYTIISSDRAYIGDVDSDDYETADFKLYVKKLGKDSVLKVPALVQYKDANNKEFEEEVILETTAYSQKQRGIAGGSKLSTVIVLLVILGGGYYLYRRWEKKKKKKKA